MQTQTVALYRPVSACFRLPFCSPQSVLQFVLADAFVVLFQFQVAFLQHINICDLNIPPTRKTRTAWNRGILVVAIIRLLSARAFPQVLEEEMKR
jgi:hypothetical protein